MAGKKVIRGTFFVDGKNSSSSYQYLIMSDIVISLIRKPFDILIHLLDAKLLMALFAIQFVTINFSYDARLTMKTAIFTALKLIISVYVKTAQGMESMGCYAYR